MPFFCVVMICIVKGFWCAHLVTYTCVRVCVWHQTTAFGKNGHHTPSTQARSFANVTAASHASSGPCHVPFPVEQLRRVTFACNRVAMAAWRLHLAEPHVDFAAEPDLTDDAWVKGDAHSSLQLHSEVRRVLAVFDRSVDRGGDRLVTIFILCAHGISL